MSLKFFITSSAIKLWYWSSWYTRFLGYILGYILITGWRIPEVWITWIKYCWYRVQCFYQSKPFIAFSILVILVFEMFDKYIWWISWFPVLSIYKFYPYIPKMFFSWERENGCFFFTYVVWTTIHHTTPKNHLMYIL